MNPRNMPHSSDWMMQFELALQMQNQHYPEPYILFGSPPNLPQSNIHQILPPPGSMTNFNLNHLPEHHDGTAFYPTTQYAHQVHPATNLELGIPTLSNSYNPCLNPATGRMFSVPLNHGSMDQFPSSSNIGGSSAHLDDHGMNSFAPDGFRGLSKRNVAEGSMGNTHYINAPATPSSLMPPVNSCHFDGGVAVVDACFSLPEYTGNYLGQSFQPPAATWCDCQPNGVGDSSILPFDLSPMSTYFEVSSVNTSSSEIGNVGGQRFHDGASTSQGSANFLHSTTPMHHALHDFDHLQNVQGASGYNFNFHLPAVATSSRHPTNNAMHHGSMSHTQQGPESVPPPPGIRRYRSHRRGVMSDGMNRHRDLPHLRLVPEEGLAILEFPGHYEVGLDSTHDHHRDMRLDIDYMSYEELLALSERIGNVNTGLSDEAITVNLKTRAHRSCMTTIDLEELPCSNEINDSCVICQDEYEDGDSIGILDCGHEYHVHCLKKWLYVKNACPVCKSTALDLEHMDA